MLGAIIGDIVGSAYEFAPVKTAVFPLFTERSSFTDDTVMTIATADALLNGLSYADAYKKWGRRYPNPTGAYGGRFKEWLFSESIEPYHSFGNGSAMRVSPIGWAFATLEETLAEAERSAAVTHDHPEGIKGAQAVAAAIFMARNGSSKKDIKAYIEQTFAYDLSRTIDDIRPTYQFNETCQGSVPESIIAFLESTSLEHAIRLAVSLGGDADTQACIAGSIAEAYYRAIPEDMKQQARSLLPNDMLDVLDLFRAVTK